MRQQLQIVLGLLLLLAIGALGYQVLFRGKNHSQITILSMSGEVVHVALDAEAVLTNVGDAIGIQDSLRTGEDGSVILGMGEASRIHLAADSSIRVLSADSAGIRVELEEGLVSAKIRPGSPSLGISSRGRAANAKDADFTVAVDAEGMLAIEPERGEVLLQGIDGVERVSEGMRMTDLPGRPPVTNPIPNSLLLEVVWPKQTVTRSREITIRGRTGPYANVQVGGTDQPTKVRAGADGRFRAKIPIREGDNALEVRATDGLGSSKIKTRSLIRDSTAPAVETEVQWGR